MKKLSLTTDQRGLLETLSRHWWARPGKLKCAGYTHAIGVSNGLKGLANAGFATWRWGTGQTVEWQITEAGRVELGQASAVSMPEQGQTV